MKIQVFEGLLLFIICVWVSSVDSLLKLSLLYTFVSSNINSESDISATNSDCIVLQSTSNVQIVAVFPSYELCNVVFASVHRQKTWSICLFQSSGLVVLSAILPFFYFCHENIGKSYFAVKKVLNSQIT